MGKIAVLFSIVFMFFYSILDSYGIATPTNLKVDSSTSSSVNLSWDPLDGAFMYSVYYSKVPWTEKTPENQTDYAENNSIEVTNLEQGTYYFSVIAIDDWWEESLLSNEIKVDVGLNDDSSFILKSIWVLSLNWIELTFSQQLEDIESLEEDLKILDTNTPTDLLPTESIENILGEFKIVNKNDVTDIYKVIKTEINPDDNTKLLLTLDRDTQINNEYELTVMEIKNTEGKNIETGVDSTKVFLVKDIDYSDEEAVKMELNSASEQSQSWKIVNKSWVNSVSGSGVELLSVAEANKALPGTWPEHLVILVLSLIIWLGFFAYKVKKS